MKIRSKDGWPVEVIKGKPIQAILRYLIHGNIRATWAKRTKEM